MVVQKTTKTNISNKSGKEISEILGISNSSIPAHLLVNWEQGIKECLLGHAMTQIRYGAQVLVTLKKEDPRNRYWLLGWTLCDTKIQGQDLDSIFGK